MKTSSKSITAIFIVTAIFYTTSLKAQTTPAGALRFNIGIENSSTTGNARLGSYYSLGGTARLQYGITNDLAITLTSGAYHFFPIIRPGTNMRYQSYGIIPIKAGLKEFFMPHIYVGAEAGIGREATDEGYGPNRLLLSPAVGYGTQHWDIGIHYDSFSSMGDTYGLLALRLAYGF